MRKYNTARCRPGVSGGISGPQNHCLCSQFGALVINTVFVGKNRFFVDFAMKTFFVLMPKFVKLCACFSRRRPFFWSSPKNLWNFAFRAYFQAKIFFMVFTLEIERKKVFAPPQKLFMLFPVTLLWRRAWLDVLSKFKLNKIILLKL